MRPAVICDLMSLPRLSGYDLRVLSRILTDKEKRRLNVVFSEEIEQLRRQFGARAVVKGHRYVRAVNVDPIERNPRFNRGRWFWFLAGLRRNGIVRAHR